MCCVLFEMVVHVRFNLSCYSYFVWVVFPALELAIPFLLCPSIEFYLANK